jgi:hypothetical protein
MRRITVKPRDVMLPFFLLMGINVAVLTAWTAAAPLTWQRTPISFDKWGRTLESHGSCSPASSRRTMSTAFAATLVFFNGMILLTACYQIYKARNLPTQFNESKYIAVAMFGLSEFLLIGIPLFLTLEDPTSSFVIKSMLISLSTLVILLPIFLPKVIKKDGVIARAHVHITGMSASIVRSSRRFYAKSTRRFQRTSRVRTSTAEGVAFMGKTASPFCSCLPSDEPYGKVRVINRNDPNRHEGNNGLPRPTMTLTARSLQSTTAPP